MDGSRDVVETHHGECSKAFSTPRFSELLQKAVFKSHKIDDMILLALCSLEELFLCLNDYETVSCSPVCCQSLKLLHITDNNLQDWTEIRKLGIMFPSLDTLILANNNLTTIEESEDSLARLFPNLRSINLHKSGESLEAGMGFVG